MIVLITGASGFIGSALSRMFLDMGWEVRGIDLQKGPVDIEHFCEASLGDPLPEYILHDVELMIHGAHAMGQGTIDKNIIGTKHWYQQAQEAGVRNQLFFTSYSAHQDAPSDYGTAKYALETFFMDKEVVLLRPGLVMGKGGSYNRLAQFLAKSKVVPIMGGNAVKTAITQIDVLCQVIKNYKSLQTGQVYNLFQKDMVGLLDMAKTIQEAYGTKGTLIPVPIWMSAILLRTAEILGVKLPSRYSDFMALVKSQKYGFESSYAELGIVEEAFFRIVKKHI
jgi:nucleoside-diphosphate-sugar epimerase